MNPEPASTLSSVSATVAASAVVTHGEPDGASRARGGLARQPWIAFEFVVLFFVLPALYWQGVIRPPLIPSIIGMALVCLGLLLLDRTFDRRLLWGGGTASHGRGLRALGRHLRVPLLRFVLLGAAMTLVVALWLPERFLSLVRTKPELWGAVMVLYPVFSVYPQEVIFRVFMFHRYRALFGDGWGMIAVSAGVFGWVHILFNADPVVSVLLSGAGGVLFGLTYRKSRSVIAVSIEHALYGDLIYTIGLGAYFYAGGAGG